MKTLFEVKSFFDGIADSLFVYTNRRKCSLIIPAYNEEKNIMRTISSALGAVYVDEVIVVDDGSTDRTFEKASRTNARVIRHEKNKGKGAAIKTGIANAKYELICFIDADIPEWNSGKINSIIKPAATNEADFVKTSFSRSSGRVTILTAKPLLKLFFPNVNFDQPLSGQFCTTKEFLSQIKIENRYGIDIGIVIDASTHGLRTKEVYIGEITNKSKNLNDLGPMAEQVARTIARKAKVLPEKYPLIVISLEKSLGREENMRMFNQTMRALKSKNHEVIIISAKPRRQLLEMIDDYNVKILFTQKEVEKKDSTDILNLLSKSYKVKPKKILFVAEPETAISAFKLAGLKISTPQSCAKVKRIADINIQSWAELLLFAE